MKNEIKLSVSLTKLSKDKNINIKSLASLVKMNTSTLHNYFCGVCPRNILALIRIAEYFEVSLDELIFGKEVVSNKREIVQNEKVFELRVSLNELEP